MTAGHALRWGAAAMATTAALLLAGCSLLVPTACSMPAIRPPHLDVDAQDWHRVHPGGTVHACYGGTCDRADGTALSFEVLVPPSLADGRTHDLAITLADGSGTVTRSARVALDRVPGQKGGPCPMPDQWSRQVRIGADGGLQFGGADDGHPVIPSP